MDLQTLTFLIVGLTFAVYIGIAFWAKASSTNEFYVAGGGVSPIANGMATAADWMSAASFISMAGMISFLGYGGSVFLMGWTGDMSYLLYYLHLICGSMVLSQYQNLLVTDIIQKRQELSRYSV